MNLGFKAPVEHSILVTCFLLIWTGPALKVAGLVDWSWWVAFAAMEGLWALVAALLVAKTLVELVVKLCMRYANRLQ